MKYGSRRWRGCFVLACACAVLAAGAGEVRGDSYTWGAAEGGNWSTGWAEAPSYPNAAGDAAVITNDCPVAVTVSVDVADAVLASLTLGRTANTNPVTLSGPYALLFADADGQATNVMQAYATNTIGADLAFDNPLSASVAAGGLLTLSGGLSLVGTNTMNNFLGQYGNGILAITGVNSVTSDLVAAGTRGIIRIDAENLTKFRRLALHGGIIEVQGGGTIIRNLSLSSTNDFYWGYDADPYGGSDKGGFAARGGALTIVPANNLDLLIQVPPGTDGYGDGLIFNSPSADSPVIYTKGINVKNSTAAPALGGDRIVTVLDNPDSEDDYFEMQGTTPLNNRHINKYGAGLWIWSYAGTHGQKHPIGVRAGELRLHGDFSYMAGMQSWIQIFNGATISGHGILPQIRPDTGATTCWVSPGGGKVVPADGIMTVPAITNLAKGVGFQFEFTAHEPDLNNRSNSLNDVLYLTNQAPFDVDLAATNVVNVYFAAALPVGFFTGGFHVDQWTPAQLLTAVQNAAFTYYRQDPSGPVRFNGTNYSLLDTGDTPVRVDTVAADGGGAITCFYVARSRGTLIILR